MDFICYRFHREGRADREERRLIYKPGAGDEIDEIAGGLFQGEFMEVPERRFHIKTGSEPGDVTRRLQPVILR
jgi:hypothetical protein